MKYTTDDLLHCDNMFYDSSRINKSTETVDDFCEEFCMYKARLYPKDLSLTDLSQNKPGSSFLVEDVETIDQITICCLLKGLTFERGRSEGSFDRSRSSPRPTSDSHVTTSNWRELYHRLQHHHRDDDRLCSGKTGACWRGDYSVHLDKDQGNDWAGTSVGLDQDYVWYVEIRISYCKNLCLSWWEKLGLGDVWKWWTRLLFRFWFWCKCCHVVKSIVKKLRRTN